tara:strand:- start:17 stop:211 length:195 start_codon:yes stop_codon:yes gene_type:complete
MKVGNLVRFWDYDGGDGFVVGLVVEMGNYRYTSDGKEVASLKILYKNSIQVVPLDSEWIPEIVC